MPEKLLNNTVLKQVQGVFQNLQRPVRLIFFGTESGCEYCADTRQLLEEITSLSDKLSLTIYDLNQDVEFARRLKVEKAPAIVLASWDGKEMIDYGIRFYGIPAGHEFSALIQGVNLVSEGESGLQDKTRQFLRTLAKPVHLQVFSTPT
jgi:glutaredoxin-like protein